MSIRLQVKDFTRIVFHFMFSFKIESIEAFFGIAGFEELRMRDLQRLETALQKDIEVFQLSTPPYLMVLRQHKRKFKNEPLRLLIDDGQNSLDTPINPILIIYNERIVATESFCQNVGCYFKGTNMARHEKSCAKEKSPVHSVQASYGKRTDIIWDLVDLDILPKEALEYRKTTFCKSTYFINLIVFSDV